MSDGLRKIDIHTHILLERWPDLAERYGYGGFIRLEHSGPGCARMMRDGEFFRDVDANCWDPRTRAEECDQAGVELQVLSTVPVMFSYWARPEHGLDLSKMLNDHIAGVVRDDPKRFAGLATLPMQSPDLAARELERSVRELGLSGAEIGTNVNGKNLDSPDLLEVFQAAHELGAALFIHPWEMVGMERMSKYWLPWLVGMPAETSLAICSIVFCGVLEKLPDLRIAFAHGGGAFPATIGRIQHGFEVRPDLCAADNQVSPREYLRRIYYDSLVHEPRMLRYMVDIIGADRIALGSDYPFPLGESVPGAVIEEGPFTETERHQMLCGTAMEWLGRPA